MLTALKSALDGFPTDSRFVIGVSGGLDSVALLHALHALHFDDLVVCHMNHLLRGAESQKDATFVRKLAMKFNYTLDSVQVDVAGYAAEHKLSIETAARTLRHQFFAICAEEHGCSQVFLAHHADDQAETVLSNTLRGCGLAGLGGMRFCTPMDSGITLLRPMLGIRRSEIADYAKEHRLKWREDLSNADPQHTRNRLRHQILPALSQAMQRDVVPALTRLATIAEREDDYLAKLTLQAFESAQHKDHRQLNLGTLLSCHAAIQHRVVHHWLKQNSVPNLSAEVIDAVTRLLADHVIARVNLPQNLQVRRKAKTLRIESQDA